MQTGNSSPRNVLITSTLASFIGPFMISSVNIALPSIEKEYSADALLLSWVVSAYILSYAIFIIPFGKLSEIHGRKKIFFLGVIAFTASSLAAPFSPGILSLLFFRFLQGCGSAMIATSGLSLLTGLYPASQRGRVIGINVASVYAGISAGPFLGGMLVNYLGWRSVFLASVPPGIIIAFMLYRIKGEWKTAEGEKFDFTGSLIYAAALALVMYASSIIPSPAGLLFFSAGGAAVIFFVIYEQRLKHPVFEISLFKSNRVFALSNFAALINYSATASVAFLLSLYLQKIMGLRPDRAGLLMMIQPLIQAIFSPVAGKLSDKIEPRILSSLGMALTCCGLALLMLLGMDSSPLEVTVPLVTLGFGFSLFSSPNMNSIMSSVENRHYGNASASAGTMRLLGQILSMSMTIIIFSLVIGRTEISPEKHPAFLQSMKYIFGASFLLCLAGVFLSLSRGRLRLRTDKT